MIQFVVVKKKKTTQFCNIYIKDGIKAKRKM